MRVAIRLSNDMIFIGANPMRNVCGGMEIESNSPHPSALSLVRSNRNVNDHNLKIECQRT
jgi:hypothetical protein